MGALSFPKPQLIKLDGNRLTDHNRADFSVDVERIENSKRMANGTLRKYVIADKRTFSTSWSNLPESDRYTVDGFWGADEIEQFYYNAIGSVELEVSFTKADYPQKHNVVITKFSKTLLKRGAYAMYDVSITLEEI